MSGGEERIKNKIESNKKYIYRKKKKKQNQKHRWEGTDFGWWPHSPGEAGPHTRVTVTSLQIAMDTHTPPRHYSLLHKRTLTESGSQLKACGGRGREGWGLFKAKSVPARGWASALATSSSCKPALVSWVWAAAAGVWERTPGGQDVTNVTLLGTVNQSWWWQQRCPVYTV